MKTINSDALDLIARALGLSGVGAPLTEFLDGQLEQVLDVTTLVRRGRTQAGTGGIYTGVLENNHGAANTQISGIEPYTTAVGAIAPYPSPMPAGFDVWIIGATVRRVSGTGTVVAIMALDTIAPQQGWGIDEAGAAVVADDPLPLGHWNTIVASTDTYVATPDGELWVPIGLRVPRPPQSDTSLNFSTTASAISVYRASVLLGVFPIGLGQDVVAGK